MAKPNGERDPPPIMSQQGSNAPDPETTVGRVEAGPPVNYDPYQQSTLLQQALTSDKMRVAFFLGAGCPVAVGSTDGNDAEQLIPDIRGLTAVVRHSLESSDQYKAHFTTITKRLDDSGTSNPNIEDMLSHIRSLSDIVGPGTIDGLSRDALNALDAEMCRLVTTVVKARLPHDDTPYHRLAAWIGGVQRAHPVELFTPNYDRLMEQALEAMRVPYFDGFVGTDRAFFDLTSMEQDTLPARWARLWKVHGSINWWRTPAGEIVRIPKGDEHDRQMIYPSHLKYDQSRRMPYFAMLDRLRAFLAGGQAVLVACGYSFHDQHLNEVILQGLNANPTAICFGLLFGDCGTSAEGVARARKQANLKLLAADGAVSGTIERTWHSVENLTHPLHGLAVRKGEMTDRTAAPTDRCKFLLGDFAALGEFLARQLSQTEAPERSTDAS